MDDTDRWMDGGRVGVFLPVGSFGVIECVGTQGPTSPGRDKINVFFFLRFFGQDKSGEELSLDVPIVCSAGCIQLALLCIECKHSEFVWLGPWQL